VDFEAAVEGFEGGLLDADVGFDACEDEGVGGGGLEAAAMLSAPKQLKLVFQGGEGGE
jgi:hypothetical protein